MFGGESPPPSVDRTLTGTHQRAMAVYHHEDRGDVVGHLPRMIALLTVFGMRTRGLRAGGVSLLWLPTGRFARQADGGGKKLVWPVRLPCKEAVRNSTVTSGRSP